MWWATIFKEIFIKYLPVYVLGVVLTGVTNTIISGFTNMNIPSNESSVREYIKLLHKTIHHIFHHIFLPYFLTLSTNFSNNYTIFFLLVQDTCHFIDKKCGYIAISSSIFLKDTVIKKFSSFLTYLFISLLY